VPHRSLLRIGVDLVEVARVRRLVDRFGERALARLFTPAEIAYAQSARGHLRYERLAARLAAKEAFIKAYGLPIPYRTLEVVKREGVPFVRYLGEDYPASLSHTEELAIAVIAWDPSARTP